MLDSSMNITERKKLRKTIKKILTSCNYDLCSLLVSHVTSAFLERKRWRYERSRRQASAEGASQGAEGAEGGVPLPTGRGVWGAGCAPCPEKNLLLELKMASFRAFLLLFL